MQRENETREEWLLNRFSAKGSETAFAELVSRHLDFVYSVCRRQVGDPELAQDITQTVFLLLAAKSGSLRPGTVLSGWLFQTALNACRNAHRTEARRRHYEQKAAAEMEHSASLTAAERNGEGPQIEPVLDDALAHLSGAERNAMLLRCVEELSPEEMGIALGISATAAQKRVSRTLERLRRSFAQTRTVLSVAALGLLLTDKLVQAAPTAASAAILAAVKSGLGAGGAGAIGSGAALGQFVRPVPVVKGPALMAAILLGGVLLTGVLLHGRTARTAVGAAKTAPAPQAITALTGWI